MGVVYRDGFVVHYLYLVHVLFLVQKAEEEERGRIGSVGATGERGREDGKKVAETEDKNDQRRKNG